MAKNPFASLLPLMDPELRAIVEKQVAVKQFAPRRSNIKAIRKGFDALTARWHNAPTMRAAIERCRKECPWTEHMISIPTRDGYQMAAKVYRPGSDNDNRLDSRQTGLPVMLLVHGGGCCLGGLDTDDFIGQFLCSKINIVVLSIAYRLYPEVVYPVPAYDTYDAMEWIHNHAGTTGSGLEDVSIQEGFLGCGVSAGGNLLGSAMFLAAKKRLQAQRDHGNNSSNTALSRVPEMTGVMMLMSGYPAKTNDPRTRTSINLYPGLCKSMTDFQDAPVANRSTSVDYVEMGGPTLDIQSPLYSLLNLPLDSPILTQMTGRWYHQLGGIDMWRDSSLLWLSILTKGKPELLQPGSQEVTPIHSKRPLVKIDDYEGLPHTWWSVYPQVSKTKQWLEDLANGARWALGDDNSSSSSNRRQHGDAKL